MSGYILLGAFIFWFSAKVVDFVIERAEKKLEERVLVVERDSLDWTIRMAYCRGAVDAVRRLDIELGAEAYVMEWRERWGRDRRETTR